MRRRDALAGAGALVAALAGCVSDDDPGSGGGTEQPNDDDPETTPDGTETPGDGTETPGDDPAPGVEYDVGSVELDALLPGVVETTSPDSIGVEGSEGRQYLYLQVTASAEGEAPPVEEFAFAVGGTEYDPKRYDDEFRHWRTGDGTQYAAADGGGWLLFELPATAEDPGAAALRWPGGEWTADETLRERLASPHPPTDVSVSMPETVDAGAQPTLSLTATNAGEVAAGVPVAVNRSGPRVAYAPLTAARLTVPPGETRTWEWTDDAVELTADNQPATYHVHWHDGDVSGDVGVAE